MENSCVKSKIDSYGGSTHTVTVNSLLSPRKLIDFKHSKKGFLEKGLIREEA